MVTWGYQIEKFRFFIFNVILGELGLKSVATQISQLHIFLIFNSNLGIEDRKNWGFHLHCHLCDFGLYIWIKLKGPIRVGEHCSLSRVLFLLQFFLCVNNYTMRLIVTGYPVRLIVKDPFE